MMLDLSACVIKWRSVSFCLVIKKIAFRLLGPFWGSRKRRELGLSGNLLPVFINQTQKAFLASDGGVPNMMSSVPVADVEWFHLRRFLVKKSELRSNLMEGWGGLSEKLGGLGFQICLLLSLWGKSHSVLIGWHVEITRPSEFIVVVGKRKLSDQWPFYILSLCTLRTSIHVSCTYMYNCICT